MAWEEVLELFITAVLSAARQAEAGRVQEGYQHLVGSMAQAERVADMANCRERRLLLRWMQALEDYRAQYSFPLH